MHITQSQKLLNWWLNEMNRIKWLFFGKSYPNELKILLVLIKSIELGLLEKACMSDRDMFFVKVNMKS